MPNQSVRLTKTVVDRLKPPERGQAFLRDIELKGFGVRVTATGVKAFIVETRIDGQVRRKTLGRYGELTAVQARKAARRFLGQVATGTNPLADRIHAKLKRTTLEQVFVDFLHTRKHLKPSTVYQYRRLMASVFADWRRRPVIAITKDMVSKRHREVGERSEAYANQAMRFLRALFNFARGQYEDGLGKALIADNPVQRLTLTRAWYPTERRRTIIKVHELPAWYAAVIQLKHNPDLESAETVADYLLLLLFTGLRRQEAATLTWEQLDLKDRTLTLPDPKNREPFTLPLSDYVITLLMARQQVAASRYVFPGGGRRGYLIEPKRQMARVIDASGVTFTLHDLRTFITAAESLDIPIYAIKRLVNHKMSGDVTAGYIVSGIERLRGPMQRISDYLLSASNARAGRTVVALRKTPQGVR